MHTSRMATGRALEALERVLSSVDHAGRDGLDPAARMELMTRARRLAQQMEALACVLTAEAHQAQASMAATGTPITSFLAVTENRDTREAAAEVFRARDVTQHRKVRDAALKGSVSNAHAAAISKGMGQLPDTLDESQRAKAEDVFLGMAETTTPRKLAALAPLVLQEVAPEHAPTPEQRARDLEAQRRRAVKKRHFVHGDDGDGSIWFRGSLPHLEAAPLIAMVEAYAQSDKRASRDRVTTMRSLRPGPQVMRDYATPQLERTPDQRRADALTTLIADHRGAPAVAGDRPRIVITLTEADLRARAETAGVLSSGATLTGGELRRLCCDADLLPTVLGSHSEILDVGRIQRLVTPAIRRALTLRDGGCVFPNCTASNTECDAHHVIPWWDNGDTSLGNLALLCPHHHAVVEPQRFNPHTDQWTITFHPNTRKPVVTPTQRLRLRLERQRPSAPGTEQLPRSGMDLPL